MHDIGKLKDKQPKSFWLIVTKMITLLQILSHEEKPGVEYKSIMQQDTVKATEYIQMIVLNLANFFENSE